jgi:hypothetical protein
MVYIVLLLLLLLLLFYIGVYNSVEVNFNNASSRLEAKGEKKKDEYQNLHFFSD